MAIYMEEEEGEFIEINPNAHYPVTKEKCEKCGGCSLVTRGITGALMDVKHQYYQCVPGVSFDCREAVNEEIWAALKKIMSDRGAVFYDHDRKPVFIADTLAFMMNDRRNKCRAVAKNSTNGSEIAQLNAEAEMYDELLKGTIVEL